MKLSMVYYLCYGFVGVEPGGLAAIIHPKEPLGVSVEALKYSPFRFPSYQESYYLPSWVGNIFSAGLMIGPSLGIRDI